MGEGERAYERLKVGERDRLKVGDGERVFLIGFLDGCWTEGGLGVGMDLYNFQ
jgi:hypothetical protein